MQKNKRKNIKLAQSVDDFNKVANQLCYKRAMKFNMSKKKILPTKTTPNSEPAVQSAKPNIQLLCQPSQPIPITVSITPQSSNQSGQGPLLTTAVTQHSSSMPTNISLATESKLPVQSVQPNLYSPSITSSTQHSPTPIDPNSQIMTTTLFEYSIQPTLNPNPMASPTRLYSVKNHPVEQTAHYLDQPGLSRCFDPLDLDSFETESATCWSTASAMGESLTAL